MPKLLVSVRDVLEAEAAITGGCQLLDIKNPAAGPLGCPTTETVAEILALTWEIAKNIPLSAALGELNTAEITDQPEIWNRLDYLKVGSAGIADLSEWSDRFQHFRQHWQSWGGGQPQWIAAFYLDHEQADSFDPLQDIDDMMSAVHNTGCCGLLFDTFNKSSLNTCAILCQTPSKLTVLQNMKQKLAAQDLLLAVAGRLTQTEILELAGQNVTPDFWAVRSAVCRGQNRLQSVSAELTQELKIAIASIPMRL